MCPCPMLRVATCSYIQYLVDSELWPRNPYVATHYDSPASHVYKRLCEGLQTSFDLVQSFIQVLLPHSSPLRRLLDLRTPVCPAQNLKTLQKVKSLLSTAQPPNLFCCNIPITQTPYWVYWDYQPAVGTPPSKLATACTTAPSTS